MFVKSEPNFNKKDCNLCGLKPDWCLCDQIAPAASKTMISVIIHITEMNRRSNSGHFAAKCLAKSKVIPYGVPWDKFDHSKLTSGNKKPLLLFPGSENIVSRSAGDSQKHLVVVDGNWRQAKRMFQKLLRTNEFEWVSLPKETSGGFALRDSSMKAGTVSTMEAIAIALRELEGEAIYDHLNSYFNRFVKAHQMARKGLKNNIRTLCEENALRI